MTDHHPTHPAAPEFGAVDTLVSTRPASLWRDTLAGILRQRSAIIGLIILGIFLVVEIGRAHV